jgi:hypothetical protein
MSPSGSLSRFAPLTGLAGIAGVIAGLALDNFPDGSYSDAQVAHWFDVHGTTRWIISGSAICLGGTLLLVFAAIVATMVDQSGAGPVTRRLASISATAWAVFTMIGGALWISGPVSVEMFDTKPTASLMNLSGPAYAVLVTIAAFAAALLAISLTTASRQTGLLPRWLTLAGYPAAALMFTNVLLPMAVITLFFAATTISLSRRPAAVAVPGHAQPVAA